MIFPRLRPKWDTVLTGLLVVCAVVTTMVVVWQQFLKSPPPVAEDQKPVYFSQWKDFLSKGVLIGSPEARVKIVEFGDFECPFCAVFHQEYRKLRERYPDDVALVYVHLPLPGHRFAMPAARAAECANEQGHFASMHDRLLQGQEQFGLKPWAEFATEAKVPNVEQFNTCMTREAAPSRVVEGKRLAEQLDIAATPTLIINGLKVSAPNSQELNKIVSRTLSTGLPRTG